MKIEQGVPILGEDEAQETGPVSLPPKRLFVVRKTDPVSLTLEKIMVEAHLIQFSTTASTVIFLDLDIHDAKGDQVTTRVVRVIFNVEDAEEVLRLQPGSKTH